MATQLTCPACNTPVPAGARHCRSCKLEVSKMTAYAAAMRAAAGRGLHTTVIEADRPAPYRKLLRPLVILPVLIVVIVIVWLNMPSPPLWWTKFPTTPMDAAQAFMDAVTVDDYASFDKGYALVPPDSRNKDDSDELGHYRQLFRTLNHYLSDEFGRDWPSRMNFARGNDDPLVIVVQIDAEVLHIRTVEVPTGKPDGKRYGVAGISEWDINDAADLQKMAGIKGYLRGVAGEGAVKNIESAFSGGQMRRESKTLTKLRLLPVMRDPRRLERLNLLQCWPIRTDPVIRRRLEMITSDGRYPNEIQRTADEILKETVSYEDLVAAGVG